MPTTTARDYRKRAEECLEIAQTVRSESQRIMLRHIAETWMRLAKDVTENSANGKSPRAPAM